MKKRVLVFILPMLFINCLSACDLAKETSDTAKDGAKDVVQQIDRSKALGDLTTITAALNTYGMQHDGAFPASLEELKLNLYYPDDLVYDPKTGKVHSKTYPNL